MKRVPRLSAVEAVEAEAGAIVVAAAADTVAEAEADVIATRSWSAGQTIPFGIRA